MKKGLLVVTRAAKVDELLILFIVTVLVVPGTAKVDELVVFVVVAVLVVARAAVGDGAAGGGESGDSHCE